MSKRYLTGTRAECDLARVVIDQTVGYRHPDTGAPLALQIRRSDGTLDPVPYYGTATSEPILPDDGEDTAAVEIDDTDRLHLQAMGQRGIPSAGSLPRARDLTGGLGRAVDDRLVAQLGELDPGALDDRNALPMETRAKLVEIEAELGPGGTARVRAALQRRKDAGGRAVIDRVLGGDRRPR